MKLPEKTTKVQFRSTKGLGAKPSFFITGMPGNGKTTLAYLLVQRMITTKSDEDILVLDFPEEDEGARTLSDRDVTFATIKSVESLDEAYEHTVRTLKPKGIVIDALPAAWKMFFADRCPNLEMPNDNGKTWNKLGTDITTRLIARFRSIPGVEAFAAVSSVWPDKDEATGDEKRLQTTLPGQLKGNIYGAFSYCFNIKVAEAQGKTVRVLETQPDAKVVAKMRKPLGVEVPKSILYDLANDKLGIDYLIEKLKLGRS